MEHKVDFGFHSFRRVYCAKSGEFYRTSMVGKPRKPELAQPPRVMIIFIA